MRCRDCRTRYTLKQHPDEYRQSWRTHCPACKSVNVRSVELERRREMQRQDTCRCFAYPFPHRAGSMMFCHRTAGPLDPTEEEISAYRSVLDTRRSAFS